MFPRSPKTDPPARPRPLALESLDDRTVPTVNAVNDVYSAARGTVLTVDAPNGVLVNDSSTQNFNAVLSAAQVGPITAVGSSKALPANTLTLNANGSFTLIVPSDLPPSVTEFRFQYQASNLLDPTEPTSTATVTIRITGTRQQFLAVGAQAGTAPTVKVFDVGTGALRYSFDAYEAAFTGGVRVAVGDINGDGVDDIVTSPGAGGGDRVKVFNGANLAVLLDRPAFDDPNFRGGGYVAVGDVDGNGTQDIIAGAGETGGPRVRVLDVGTFATQPGAPVIVLADFFAYESTFRNGVRVAAGDLDGSGRDFIVTAPGSGGGPVVKVFDYLQVSGILTPPGRGTAGVAGGAVSANPLPLRVFLAGSSADRSGVFVSTGDFGGNGLADIVVGSGAGQSIVQVYDGQTLGLIRQFTVPSQELPVGGGSQTGPNASFYSSQTRLTPGTLLFPTQAPGSLTSGQTVIPGSGLTPGVATGGVTVTAVDWNGDGLDDVITGAGPGNQSRVRVFDTRNNSEITNFLAYDANFLGGINVGG